MTSQAKKTLALFGGIPIALIGIAVAAFFLTRAEELTPVVLLEDVEAYEYNPNRSAIYAIQDDTLIEYVFSDGSTRTVKKLQTGEQLTPRDLYVADDNTIIVSDVTKEKSVLHVLSDPADSVKLVTEETIRADVIENERTYCEEKIGEPAFAIAIGTYTVIVQDDESMTAYGQYVCENQLADVFIDERAPLLKNPNFEIDGTFIAPDTTISDGVLEVVITSRADSSELLDCSGFFGANCPVTHTVKWRDKTYQLKEQFRHVGKSLPHSRYLSNAAGELILPSADGTLLLFRE